MKRNHSHTPADNQLEHIFLKKEMGAVLEQNIDTLVAEGVDFAEIQIDKETDPEIWKFSFAPSRLASLFKLFKLYGRMSEKQIESDNQREAANKLDENHER